MLEPALRVFAFSWRCLLDSWARSDAMLVTEGIATNWLVPVGPVAALDEVSMNETFADCWAGAFDEIFTNEICADESFFYVRLAPWTIVPAKLRRAQPLQLFAAWASYAAVGPISIQAPSCHRLCPLRMTSKPSRVHANCRCGFHRLPHLL